MSSCLNDEENLVEVPYLTRRRCTGLNLLAQCYSKLSKARQVEEIGPHQGEHPLTVAPTSMWLRVSAPSTRFKLLKTNNWQFQQAKSLKNGKGQLVETSTDGDPTSV